MTPDIGEVVEAAVGPLVVFDDGQLLTMGTGDPFSFSYDVTDADAHFVKASYTTLAGDTVPILALGIGIAGVDLGVFDSLTQPAYAVFDADRDSYIKIGFVSDDVAEILANSQININAAGGVKFDGGAVFNEGGNDVDFRVEGENDEAALFVEGSSDGVIIGAGSSPAFIAGASSL